MCTVSSFCVVSFADEGTLYINTPENDELITKNPGKGWIRYGNGPSEVYDTSLAEKALYYSKTGYMRFRWDVIEPEEGQFNWAPIDNALAAWDSVGMGYGFGVMCLDTTQKEGQYTTPKWVFDAGAEYWYGDMKALESDARAGAANSNKMYLPIQDDPIYMEKVENFVKALAERYDNDPRVEFIDIRSYGNYGEFHIIDCPPGFPPISNEAMRWHIDVHAKYFKNTQVIIPTGFGYNINKSVVEPEYIYNRNIGVRHDGGYDKTATVPYFHGYQPAINEQGPPYEQFKAAKGFHHDMYLDYVGNMKFSYMDIGEWGRNTETFIKEQEPIIRFLTNKIGYHFVMQGVELPKSVSAGQDFNVTFDWINKGITYLYKDAIIDVALLDENDKVVKTYRSGANPTRNWAPDELVKDTVGINLDNLANGNYKLAIGITLNEGKQPYDGKPDFQIGNYGMTSDKWYVFANAVKTGNTFTFSKFIEENLVNGVSLCSEPVVSNGMNYVKADDVVKTLSSSYEVAEGGNITATIDTQVITIDVNNFAVYQDGAPVDVANAVIKRNGVYYVAVPALEKIASIEINDTPAVREIVTQFYKGSLIERLGTVTNGGFEIDNNAWSYDSNYFNITTDDKCEGNQSLRFAGNSQSSCYQHFDIEEDCLYTLSFKIKSDGPLTFKITSSTGDVMASKTTESTNGEWKEYSMNFDYFDIGTRFVQKLWKPATVTLSFDSLSNSVEGYIDDVKIDRIGSADTLLDPDNFVVDYGFESVTHNWSQYLGSNMARVSDNPHSGTYCFQWDAINSGYGVNYPIVKGKRNIIKEGGAGKYHFEGWFRTEKGETVQKFGLDPFRIYTYNKQGVVSVTEGAPHWGICNLTGEWQKIEFDYEITQEMIDKINNNVPGLVTTNYAMIHITLSSGNRHNSRGTRAQIFMDDIKITKVE